MSVELTFDSEAKVPSLRQKLGKVKVAAQTRWWRRFIQDKLPDLFGVFASMHKESEKAAPIV